MNEEQRKKIIDANCEAILSMDKQQLAEALVPATPSSALGAAQRAPRRKDVKPSGKPITADCYAQRSLGWSGGATPRAKGQP